MLTSSDPSKKKTSAYNTSSQYQTAVQPGMASPSSNLQSPSTPGTVNVAGTQTQIPTQSSGKSGGFNRGPATPQSGTTTPGIKQQPGISPAPGYPRDEHGHLDMGERTRWYRKAPGGGFEYGYGAAMPEGEGWNKDMPEAPTGGGVRSTVIRPSDPWARATAEANRRLRSDGRTSVTQTELRELTAELLKDMSWENQGQTGSGSGWTTGQPMTLRDAYSTLQNAGFGSNLLR